MQIPQALHTRKLQRYSLQGPCAYQFDAGNTGSWRIERPQVDSTRCIACKTCERYCPADVITVDRNATEKVVILWDYCKGCGICANECPRNCISMVSEKGGA